MVVIGNEQVEARFTAAWQVWLRFVEAVTEEPMSHVQLTEEAVRRFENTAGNMVRAAESQRPVAAGVKCTCPADICPAHGRLDKSEARKGRKVRD